MHAEAKCPALSVLERHISGDGDQAVLEHVSSCESCATQLSRLRADQDLGAELRAASERARRIDRTQPLPEIEGYDLEGEIHRGGQGIVYRALQRSTKRTVAIKLMLDGAFASERQRLRFEREVELAASLDHPGIVAVHDSGLTKDGRSYFVMEHIDGVPATHYVGPRDSIDLAIEICEAVEAAHLRGVLHRDLKPGNILIDGNGKPHVLDFGLAATAAPLAGDDSPRLTRTGEFMGTLAYASPEHVTGDPNQLDVRSDVYTLGVILYELFTGRLPYSVDGSTLDAVRAVAEAEPAPFRVRGSRDSGAGGELATVVLTALDKDKERRYPSAGSLAEDLRRYRDGEPLWARRDSLRYVLNKTLRRYRWRAAALAAVFLGSIGSTIAISVLYQRAENDREQMTRQSGRATEISEFFQVALESISPDQARGRTVTVSEVLDEAARRLESEPPRYPEAELELRMSVGGAYTRLGQFTRALPHLQRAVRLAHDVHGPERLETAVALLALGDVQIELAPLDQARATYADALAIFGSNGALRQQGWTESRLAAVSFRLGDLERAEQRARRARELWELAGESDAEVSASLLDWAALRRERGDLERAERDARDCIVLSRASNSLAREARAHEMLGLILADQHRYAGAKDELTRALEGFLVLFPESHLTTTCCRTRLARVVLRGEGREAAAELIEECFAQRDFLLASQSHVGALALDNLSLLARLTCDYEDAENLQRQALAQYDEVFEQDTFFESTAQLNLAWTLYETAAYDEAEQRAAAATEVVRRLFGDGSPREVRAVMLLGWIDVGRGRWAEAVQHGRDALESLESSGGSEDHIGAMTDLGSFLFFAGQNEEALVHLEEARRRLVESDREPDADWARTHHALGEALSASFRLEEARDELTEALRLRKKFLGEQHAYTAQTKNALAMVLWFQNDPSTDAKELLEEALESLRPFGEDHTYTAWVLNNLGAWYRQRENDLDRAFEYVSEGVEHARRTAAPNHPLLALNLANLALVHSDRGEHTDARPLLEESYRILVEVRGPSHQQTEMVRQLLVKECVFLGEDELADRYRGER